MKKLFILLTLGLFVFTSCENEEEDEKQVELTPAEAKAEVRDVASNMDLDVVDLINSEGIEALAAFSEIFDDVETFEGGREAKQKWVKKKLGIISQAIVKSSAAKVSEDDDFVFDDIKGIWEWNSTLEDFEKTADANVFTVKFPSEGSDSNDAELTISKLEFVTVTDSDEWGTYTYQEPSEIEGSLTVDGVEYLSLDLSIEWTENGYPVKANASLNVVPFTMSLSFDDTQARISEASSSITKNGNILIAIDTKLTFLSENKEEVTKVEGGVQYANMKIQGSVDPTFEWEDEGDGVVDDLNDFVDLEVLIDGSKVGDIVFIDDLAYIEYEDGDKVLVEEILQPVIDRVEAELEEFDEEA
ncbi:MAG: hypothetical protein AAFY41_05465 [Bacteroidota bacterium]